jgi:hypothetical protein
MRVEEPSTTELLGELTRLLASAQLPVQQEIAAAAGVHQSLVSRAQNGHLKRMTAKVRTLLEYARSRAGAEEAAAAAAKSVDAEEVGGPASADGGIDRGSARLADAAAECLRREALDGVETYLQEGYDPRLIVEQLAVLRRAQRLRRPGRSRPSGVGRAHR